MSDQPTLPISVEVKDGDYGRQYVFVMIGDVEVNLYQSEYRPGGVTIDVNGESIDLLKLSVCVNDEEVW